MSKSKAAALNLDYVNAATILTRRLDDEPISIVLVGCGGTGSYMALQIGRILKALNDKGVRARGIFVDHDRVEPANIGRQLFCEAEIGQYKAEVLALRYGTAWGLEILSICTRFKASLVGREKLRGLVVLVGCVDNAAGRRELSRALQQNGHSQAPLIWWLDCGNHFDSGQVLLGNALIRSQLKGAFPSAKICQTLPAPSLQRPELLRSRPEEKASSKRMSCAELVAANLQSLNINFRIAAEAGDMLTRLLVTRDLKRYACEVNLSAGSMRSFYATPAAIGAAA